MIAIIAAPFDPYLELSRWAGSDGEAGALASFIGYCRADGGVTALELEYYPGFTESEIARAADLVARAHQLLSYLVIHRVGAIPVGEPIVLAAAFSRHRVAAFKAVEALMDVLKTDAPIWKRELRPEGARWIEPSLEDRARRAGHGGDQT